VHRVADRPRAVVSLPGLALASAIRSPMVLYLLLVATVKKK